MFHVELRQSIHQGRRFNMTREQLDAEFLRPWAAGREITIDEHDYEPKRAKLKVFEARELVVSELGLGRGWQIVQKEGEDVTERVLADARGAAATATGPASPDGIGDRLAEFKQSLLGACSLEARPLEDLVRLAGLRYPGARVSECVALAERAVWELLHQQRLTLLEAGDSIPIPPERWQELILSWESWQGSAGCEVKAL